MGFSAQRVTQLASRSYTSDAKYGMRRNMGSPCGCMAGGICVAAFKAASADSVAEEREPELELPVRELALAILECPNS